MVRGFIGGRYYLRTITGKTIFKHFYGRMVNFKVRNRVLEGGKELMAKRS